MKWTCGFTWVIGLLLLSCTVSKDSLNESLNNLAKTDLDDIVLEIRDSGADSIISENPEYKIVDFKFFKGDSGRAYKAYACVHFFYLSSLNLHQIRKYRFNSVANFWDRYDIKLKHSYPAKDPIIDNLD